MEALKDTLRTKLGLRDLRGPRALHRRHCMDRARVVLYALASRVLLACGYISTVVLRYMSAGLTEQERALLCAQG